MTPIDDNVAMNVSENASLRALLHADEVLCQELARLRFAPPVHTVYNPLEYAGAMHRRYVETFAHVDVEVLFLGMNPGPFGMTQTGIPFGEIIAVREWMKLDAAIGKPAIEHPRRPIEGLACTKSEVSGRRLWGLFKHRFGTPAAFFAKHYVANYCPLVFMEESGANRTPDKLPAAEARALQTACDAHLITLIKTLRPKWLIGVGVFAKKQAEEAVAEARITTVKVGTILHPSPANPGANRDWGNQATKQLIELGIWH
jgi:single-strand selective monofunctional uracil DNA glycosylase